MARLFKTVSLLGTLSLLGAACVSDPPNSLLGDPDDKQPDKQYDEDPTDNIATKPGNASAGEDNTYDHMDSLGTATKDPFQVLAEREEEGPPEVRTRLHSCQKVQVATLRNLLVGFGVDMEATGDPPTAAQLLNQGQGALGAANYDARDPEAVVWSASGAAKLFDIFSQAAPEIIANVETIPLCQVDGVGSPMFDGDEEVGFSCNPTALTCIMGRPATEEHLTICKDLINSASDVEKGKAIAVATMLSAAHSCE